MATPAMVFLTPEMGPFKQEGHGYLVSSGLTLREPWWGGVNRTSNAVEEQV